MKPLTPLVMMTCGNMVISKSCRQEKSAPEDVKEDLFKFIQTGEAWEQEFIDGCTKDPDRFRKPIKRMRVKNLARAAVARKVKGKDAKLVVLKTTTDLLGPLVYRAFTQEIDLASVFEYPLTPLPLSLAAIDGSMNKTSKSALTNHLNDLVSHGVPDEIDVVENKLFLR